MASNVTFATRSLRLVPLCTGQRMTNLNLSLIALSIQLQFWSVTLHDGLNRFHVCMYILTPFWIPITTFRFEVEAKLISVLRQAAFYVECRTFLRKRSFDFRFEFRILVETVIS